MTLRTHNYLTVNTSHHESVDKAANYWAEMGWRVVGAISPYKAGYAISLVLERPVEISHPDDPMVMR